MSLNSGSVASDIANLADEAASLFDSIVKFGGSRTDIPSRLESVVIHLIETLRAFYNVANKPSTESYPLEAIRAHLDRVSGWLADLRQTLQEGSTSEATKNRQNDDAGALGSPSASETTTDRYSFSLLKQSLIPLLNELTLTLHLYHRTIGKTIDYQGLRAKLAEMSTSIFVILNEPQPINAIWHGTFSPDVSPTFVVRQLEEEPEQRYASSKVVRRERTVCLSAGLPKKNADHTDSLGYKAQPLESLLLKNLSPENKWSWEIVLFKGKNRVWVRLSDVKHDGFGQLESFSQQLAMAFIRVELAIGLSNQVGRGATKLETLGRVSLEETSVLRAKSDLSSPSTRLLVVELEFSKTVLKLSNPPPALRQLLHYDALASLLCVKFQDEIHVGALLAKSHFLFLMNVVTPQKVTSYEVLVYHDTEVSFIPDSPVIRLNNVQCNFKGSSSRLLSCSRIDFQFSAQNAANHFLECIERMQERVLQKCLIGPTWQEKVIYQQYDAKQSPESKLEPHGRQLAIVFNPRNSQYRVILNQYPECNAVCFNAGADLFGVAERGLSGHLQYCPIWAVERYDSGELEHQKIPWADVSRCGRPGPHTHAVNATMIHRESEVSPDMWMENFDDLVAVLKARKKSNETDGKYKQVKIAILDTGIRKDHRMVRKVVYHDCLEGSSTTPQDFTGHGTNSVELVLKACVDAELFVGRIFGYNSSNETLGPTLMAKGIDWATEQKVDIISISAGFKRTRLGCPSPLREAVDRAAKAGILIFAAASNWGNKDDIAYPAAIKDQVMCIFATDGANRHVRAFNPDPRDDADNFAILGENVKITEGRDRDSGTSMATALAAGLAGIDNLGLIGTKAGITAISKRMSKGRKEGYDCVIPWKILKDSAPDRSEQRAQARIEISLALREAT
ncbi:hypothetical protein B0A49_07278 [Cryomyces minteri]|uniref:Peptidase S8/S53 domain-containing protein n=1 Tax=Cryomyces minteri TaxID=331657 RepID=A0A4U0WUJ5_9PEZI|nr:hypothetical protein B0A49_07278 [Cryomyces minteri]